MRDLFYSLEKDGYAGNDLSILAPHLFEGHRLRQWAYQQTPGSVLWIVRDDGLLLALTYLKEHDIWGWSRHPTAGEVLSVCSISGPDSDELLLVVRRRDADGDTRYCLERLAPQWQDSDPVEEAFFVDCGLSLHREEAVNDVDGLDHLEGQSLAVLADGSPVEGCVVRQGRIRLPFAARIVQAGLPYASVLSPLPVEGNGRWAAAACACTAAWAGATEPAETNFTTSPSCPGAGMRPANLSAAMWIFCPPEGTAPRPPSGWCRNVPCPSTCWP